MRRLREKGLKLVDAEPRPGARGRLVAFVHPRSAHGVLLELVQESAGSGSASTQQDQAESRREALWRRLRCAAFDEPGRCRRLPGCDDCESGLRGPCLQPMDLPTKA